MSFFRNLEPRSRRVVFLATLAYLASVAVLLVLARSSQATVAVPNPASDQLRTELIMIGDKDDQIFRAPLQSTEVEIYISGPVARTRVRQTFINPFDVWMEGIYVYPLPDKAAVDRLNMVIGERKILGVIKEKEEARRAYIQARREGKRASLVSQERPNIFTTEVANIGPGEKIVIEIEYQEALEFNGASMDLRFPMVVRPRFNPGDPITSRPASGTGWSYDTKQVPDASRITPPIQHPDKGSLNPVKITVFIDAGFPLDEILSSYHPITVIREGNGRAEVRLKEGVVPADRDFVLRWSPKPGSVPIAGVFTQVIGNQAYHLVMIIPPSIVSTQEVKAHIPRELIYIIDVSGSMAGDAIREAKAALEYSLNRLKPGDSFNIIAFSNQAKALFEGAKPVGTESLAEAKGFIRALIADGGTNMASALAIALDGRTGLEKLRQIIFVTDGAVGNEEALFQMIHKGLGSSRLFTVGISSAPNSFFMTEAAEIGRGTYTYIGDMKEVEEHMDALFQKIASPVLTDIKVNWPAGVGAVSYPDPIPDLYAGKPVIFAARTSLDAKGVIEVTGRTAGAIWSRKVTLDTSRESPGVASLWARSKILEITRAARRTYSLGDPEYKSAVTTVALKHSLVSKYTSLVAIDNEIARPKGEKLHQGAVPTNLPAGMDPAFLGRKSADQSVALMATPPALGMVPAPSVAPPPGRVTTTVAPGIAPSPSRVTKTVAPAGGAPAQEKVAEARVKTKAERLRAAVGAASARLALPATDAGSDFRLMLGLLLFIWALAWMALIRRRDRKQLA